MYRYFNKNSHNNKIDDCVIRALSTLENKSWRDTFMELSELSSEKGLMFSNVEFVEDYLDKRYPRQIHDCITIGEFANKHPFGRFAITMPNHITAIINGDIIDTFDCSNRIMRCAWYIGK